MSSKDLLGDEIRKVDPSLRVYTDCKIEVNTIRAEHSANLKVHRTNKRVTQVRYVMSETSTMAQTAQISPGVAQATQLSPMPSSISQATQPPPPAQMPSAIGSMKDVEGAEVAVFIHTSSPATNISTREMRATARLPKTVKVQDAVPRGNLVVGSVQLNELRKLIEHEDVMYVEAGQALAAPRPKVSADRVGEPPQRDAQGIETYSDDHQWGQDVLIGIIDVEGFDFAHEDFLNEDGTTRFVSIWDQGGEALGVGGADKHSMYGTVLTQDSMNQAMNDARTVKVPAYLLAPQSQMVVGAHGTHVASIAAGNHSFCRRAKIVGVLLTVPKSDMQTFDETGIVRSEIEKERRFSFFDSSRIAHAVEYILKVAEEEGKGKDGKGKPLPVAINISLGTNGHAHDGTVAVSRWLDNALSVPGRAVCVAAGNAGQEDAAFEGDTGYVMGRIHTSGHIPATNLLHDIEWIVVGNGLSDLSENEMEIWYGPHDRFAVQVKPPGMPWTQWIEPRAFLENEMLVKEQGTDKQFVSFLSIYNELFHPANGSNYISIYLSPFLSEDPQKLAGIKPGKWIVRLAGRIVRDGHYHAWIERDDPRPIGRVGTQEFWRFPSFFSTKSNVDNSSVGSLACGQRVISVANLDEAGEMIAITSSQGPTRDGRFKPDIAAPGTDIVAAKGFAGSDDAWVKMSGTSMAAPYVTSVAGLMLAIEPKLTAAQIEGIMKGTTDPLPGTDYAWSDRAGFGRINAPVCVAEAVQATMRNDLSSRYLDAQRKGGKR
jgi:subtilisin family serine protease